jgi:mono/diheme cytochrome c family protein
MRYWPAVSALALGLSPLVAAAQDVERGRTLYETYCLDCHYPRVHERPRDRSEVQNLSQLRDMVASRATLTKYRFSLDEKEDVVQYLNRSYYKFAK